MIINGERFPYHSQHQCWCLQGRRGGLLGLTDRLECGPYVTGIPGMELDLAELTHVKKRWAKPNEEDEREGKRSGWRESEEGDIKKRKWVTEGKREMEEDESSECRRRQRGGKVEGRREGGGVVIGRRTIQQDGKNR